MSTASCLLEAIEKVRKSKTLGDAEQAQVIDALKQEISAVQGSAEIKIAKALRAAQEASREIFSRTVSAAKRDVLDTAMTMKMSGETGLSAAAYWDGRIVRSDSYSANPVQSIEDIITLNDATFRAKLSGVVEMLYEPVLKGASFKHTADGSRIRNVLNGATDPNPKIMRAAKIVRIVQDEIVERKRAAGVYIERRPDYWEMTHDFQKVQESRSEWFAFMEERLDPKEFPDPKEYAEHLYRKVGGRTSISEMDFRPGQAPRYTKFRKPEDYGEYADRFGSGEFGDQLQDMIAKEARILGLIEALGPDPKMHMKNMTAIVAGKISREKGEAQAAGASVQPYVDAAERMKRANSFVEAYMHPASDPLNATVAWVNAGTSVSRGFVLGMSVLWDVVFDPVVIFNSAVLRQGFASAASQTVDGYLTYISKMKTVEGRAYLEGMSVQTMALNATQQSRYLSGDYSPQVDPNTGVPTKTAGSIAAAEATAEFGNKANGVVQRVTMASSMRRRNLSVAALMAARNMASQAKRDWSSVRPAYRALLQNFGINESVWPEIRKLPVDAEGALDTRNAEPWLRELVRSAMIRDGRNTINMPGMRERQTMGAFGRDLGTITSIAKAAFTPFMGYPLGFINNSMQQQMRLGGWGSVGFVGSVFAASMLMIQIKAALQGKPTYDWTNPDLWWRAALGAGFAGPMAEGLIATVSPFSGATPAGRLLPLTIVGRPLGSLAKMGDAILDGEYDKSKFYALKTVSDSVPNLLPIEIFKHRVMNAVAMELHPDYIRSQERLARDRATGIFEE